MISDSNRLDARVEINVHGFVFGETEKTRELDAYLLFYVAITRAKEKLFILTSTPPAHRKNSKNILDFLDDKFLT